MKFRNEKGLGYKCENANVTKIVRKDCDIANIKVRLRFVCKKKA